MDHSKLDDIEDMSAPLERSDEAKANTVVRKVIRSKHGNSQEEYHELLEGEVKVPGSHTIWLKTYGCSHNVSDGEYMQGLLADYGYRFTEDRDAADLWLLNSCTVKDPSQASFMHLVKAAQEKAIGLVVAGCVPQADRKLRDQGLAGISMVGVQQIDKIVDVVEQTLAGNKVRHLGQRQLPLLDLPKVRRNPLVEIIPLSTGCLGACTYCKTRHARGALGSYDPQAIAGRVRAVVAEGVTEVWLTSEDTGAYGRDLGTSLAALLDLLLPLLPEDVMLRVGMTNPPFILAQLDAVAAALNHPNVFAFLHVPVQSGSDAVLGAMRREYTAAEFRRVADRLLGAAPGMTLATDIICGFPGETEEDFEETMKLISDYKLGIVNISQFYPRPGTPAAKMKRVDTKVVKERSRRLTRLFTGFAPYAGMEGTVHKIWINTEVTDDGQYNVGHTKQYVKVLVPRDDAALVGATARARVLATARFHVVAELVGPARKVPSHVGSEAERAVQHPSERAQVTRRKRGQHGEVKRNSPEEQQKRHGEEEKEEEDTISSQEGGCCGGGGSAAASATDGVGGDCCGGNSNGACSKSTSGDCCGGKSTSGDCCGGGLTERGTATTGCCGEVTRMQKKEEKVEGTLRTEGDRTWTALAVLAGAMLAVAVTVLSEALA